MHPHARYLPRSYTPLIPCPFGLCFPISFIIELECVWLHCAYGWWYHHPLTHLPCQCSWFSLPPTFSFAGKGETRARDWFSKGIVQQSAVYCLLFRENNPHSTAQHSTVFGNNIQIGAIFCSREEALPCGNCNSKTSSSAVRVEAIYMKWSKKCTNMSGNKLRNRSIPAFQGHLRSFELVSKVEKIRKFPSNLAWNCSASSCGE